MDRRRLWVFARTLFGLAVIVGVGRYFHKTLTHPDFQPNLDAIRWPLLVPAGLLYLLCHTLWGTFWSQLLWQQSQTVPWRAAVAAYFVSQFGKYVPGKAWVIVMRVAILRTAARRVVAVTGIFETLTSMAAGALLGVATIAATGVVLPPEMGSWGLYLALSGVPLAVWALMVIGKRITKRDALPLPPALLLLRGLLQDSLGWLFLAVSLHLTILAVLGVSVDIPACLAAVCLSYVAGFVVLVAPGGLGVREWILALLIAPHVGTAEAMVVALVLRLVWTVAELIVAGTLWVRNSPPLKGGE